MSLSLPFREILATIAAALSSVPLLGAPAAHAALPGMNPDLTWGLSPATRNWEVAEMRRAGVSWVRLTLNWDLVEPRPGHWSQKNLRMYYNAIQASRRGGLNVLLLVSRSPTWASGSSNVEAPPRDPRDYAKLVHFLARRWGPLVQAYEIWNEQNQWRFWPSGPNPNAYARLLRAAYGAIKSANPQALVVFGGITNDYHYLARAYRAGIRGYFDVMSDHPYSCSLPPEKFTRSVTGRIQPSGFLAYREIHRTMAHYGDGGKPIWFTEFGWSTNSKYCGVTEQQQGSYLARAYRLMRHDSYVGVGFWYDWRNNYPYRDADAYQAQFGLFNSRWTAKPAFTAFVRSATGSLSALRRGRTSTTGQPHHAGLASAAGLVYGSR
jgi:polysaccharide biosynthesis protein PslG